MSEDRPTGRPRSRGLGPAECRQRLSEQTVARVAWQGAAGLQLLPVSYTWHERRLVFRTSAYGLLAELAQPTAVVVEVDDLSVSRRLGWSVVVHGTASGVAEPAELVSLWTVDGLVPWAEGLRTMFVEVRPTSISGRQFDRVS